MPANSCVLKTTFVASMSACCDGKAASQSGTGYEPTTVVRMAGGMARRSVKHKTQNIKVSCPMPRWGQTFLYENVYPTEATPDLFLFSTPIETTPDPFLFSSRLPFAENGVQVRPRQFYGSYFSQLPPLAGLFP